MGKRFEFDITQGLSLAGGVEYVRMGTDRDPATLAEALDRLAKCRDELKARDRTIARLREQLEAEHERLEQLKDT